MRTVHGQLIGMAAIVVTAAALSACHGNSRTTRPGPVATGSHPVQHTETVASAATVAMSPSSPPASAGSPAHAQIGARLAAMAKRVSTAANGTQAAALSSSTAHVNKQGEIQIYVYVKQLTPALETALVKAGVHDVSASPPLGLYQAWASPAAIERIATLPGVTKITLPVYGFPRTGGH